MLKKCGAILVSIFLVIHFTSIVLAAVPEDLAGVIKIDGSSTVYPITEAVSEEFGSQYPKVKVTVGISGTGGGFKKFCAGETDISNASRPIKSTEIELCKKNGVEYIELPVAYDALTVVVNPKNTWADAITVAELKKIWEPEAQGVIKTWKQIRADWPDQPIRLYGAGVDSGTYDYFTEAITGKEKSSRGDYTSSEDDNTIVQGVANDVNALGFFGLAYYHENQNKLKSLAIDDLKEENGKGPQLANVENVKKGIYQPLSRPLFIYVSKKSIAKNEVAKIIEFYLTHAQALSEEVGYIQLPQKVNELALTRFKQGIVGSMFGGTHSQVGMSLEDRMQKTAIGG
jgi:phosphate transport system substrate-binding protein